MRSKGAPVTEADFNRVFVNLAIVDRERGPDADIDQREYYPVPDEKTCCETYIEDDNESQSSTDNSTHDDPQVPPNEPLRSVSPEQRDPVPWTHDLSVDPEVENNEYEVTVTRLPNEPGVGRQLQLGVMESVRESMAARDAAREKEVMQMLKSKYEPAIQIERSQTYASEDGQHTPATLKQETERTGTKLGRPKQKIPPNIIRRPKRAIQKISVWEPWSESEIASTDRGTPMCTSPEPLNPGINVERNDNEKTMWTKDSDDGVKEEPVSGESDQKDHVESADSGPEPVSPDPWEIPRKSDISEIYPTPGQSLAPMEDRFPENREDPRVYELLKQGAVLNRETDLNRDPNFDSTQGTTQRLFCKNPYDEGSENDYLGDCKPDRLQYVPRPEPTPNGIMACLEVFPYANNVGRREHHFMAYGITLATRDKAGKLVQYNGDANIRITEPPAGITIEVPDRKRTEATRRVLFREAKLKRKEKAETRLHEQKEEGPPRPGTPPPDQIAPDALEAILEQIKADPILEDNQVRTYKIQKQGHVPIIVRTGTVPARDPREPPTRDHKGQVLTKKDNEVSEHAGEQIRIDRDHLTALGSDPLASDHAGTVESHAGLQKMDPMNRIQEWRLDTLAQNENDLHDEELTQGDEGESIKGDSAHPSKSPPLILKSQNDITTETTKDGQCTCTPCLRGKLDLTTKQLFEPPISHEDGDLRSAELTQPKYDALPVGVGTPDRRIERIPHARMDGPGVMAVEHLIEKHPSALPPGEHSFLGYNVLLVGDLGKDRPSTRQGHAYIHLFNTSWGPDQSEDSFNDGRPEAERIQIFRDHAMECLKVHNIAREPANGAWDDYLTRYTQMKEKPLAISEVNTEAVYGDFVRMREAVAKLRALRNEIRLSKPRVETAKLPEVKTGKLSLKPHETRNNLPGQAVQCQDVEPLTHPRLENEADDLPELIKVLDRPEATLNVPKPEAEKCECGEWIRRERRPRAYIETRTLVPIEVKQEDMDVPIPGSPPALNYPSDTETYQIIEIEDAKPEGQNDVPIPIKVATAQDVRMVEIDDNVVLVSPETKPAEIRKTLHRILTNLGYLSPEIERMTIEEKKSFVDALQELGLLQIACDMAHLRMSGKELDPEFWKKAILNALVERGLQGGLGKDDVVKMDEDRNELVVQVPPLAALMVSKEEEGEDDDDDMDFETHQNASPAPELLPNPPTTPTEWYPDVQVPPYVPASPAPNKQQTYMPKSPEPPELDDLRDQLSNLEDRLEESTQDLERRMKSLERQMFLDGCELTNLKWKEAELRKTENRMRANKKKTFRRSAPNPKEHRYPTRQSLAEEKWWETKSSIGAVENKIKALEERVEKAKQEVDQLKGKIDQVLALVPRLEELGKTVDAHRREQGDMNSLLLSEVSDFKNTMAPAMKAQIKQHSLELTALTQSYHQLYAIAAAFMYSNQQQNGQSYRNNYSAYGPPFNTPEKKAISVF